ncbi:hypothetical protein ACH4E7_23645 [Kitasatospora sp. NPDC018058]|uniref:hypothetical protein n=1 Tax=Kitasatospora sp. NPDC018058 TaxID=3364025 RepID=UPI0037C1186C
MPMLAPVVESSALSALPWATVVLRAASIAARPASGSGSGFTAGHAGLSTAVALTCAAIAVFVGHLARSRAAGERAPASMAGAARRGVLQPPGRMGDLTIAVRCASAAGVGQDRDVLYEVMETPFGARVVRAMCGAPDGPPWSR